MSEEMAGKMDNIMKSLTCVNCFLIGAVLQEFVGKTTIVLGVAALVVIAVKVAMIRE